MEYIQPVIDVLVAILPAVGDFLGMFVDPTNILPGVFIFLLIGMLKASGWLDENNGTHIRAVLYVASIVSGGGIGITLLEQLIAMAVSGTWATLFHKVYERVIVPLIVKLRDALPEPFRFLFKPFVPA